MMDGVVGQGVDEVFVPYGPRILHRWLAAEPDRRVRTVDASIAFIDVTGYTRLADRLARTGAAGAEAVTETMDRIFAALIDPALHEGGDVLQFSGDALLLLFEGDAHAVRACTAVREMQRVMAEVGGVDTVAGRARLRMSAGVHSGPIDFVLLGERQRMVLAVGPEVTACLRAEKEGRAGEVLVTGATAAAVPAGWLRSGRDGLQRLGRVPRPVMEAGAAEVEVVEPEVAVPEPLRPWIRDRAPGEYRQVALAFVAVRDLDGAITRDGLAAVADRLQALALGAEAAQRAHGVTWAATDAIPGGADLVLVAGAPSVTEEDEERILRATRDLLDADTGLRLAAGVHRGRNFIGPIGHPARRTVSITGDATNLTARIMAHAEVGQLLVSDHAARRVQVRLDAAPVEPFTVKGKRTPVRAVAVHGFGGRHVPDGARLAIIGRGAELERLESAFVASAPGSGRVVDLVAPAGMGKTRLVEALRERTGGAPWLVAAGDAANRVRPYFPFRAALRSALDIPSDAAPGDAAGRLMAWVRGRAPHLEARVSLLAIVADAAIDPPPHIDALEPEARRTLLHAVVVDALATAVTPPVVLVLEDLHWYDDASRDLAAAVVDAAEAAGWFVLTTSRPTADAAQTDAGDGSPRERIVLEPLGPADARTLTLALAGDVALSDLDLDRIGTRADGNPLFLRELVGSVTDGDGSDDLPETVERVIAARLDRLPPARRLRLREAAVLGRTADLALLGALTDDPALAAPAAWSGVDEFVTVADDAVVFHHDLLRDVAYDGLSLRRRIDLHARAARALADRADDDAAGIVAGHAAVGREWALAWEWSRRAAARARARTALSDALAAAEQALEAARHLPDLPVNARAAAHEDLAEIAYPLAEYAVADHGFALAGRLLASDPIALARCRRRRGDIAVLEGRFPQAKRWYTLGLRSLDGIDGEAATRERVRLRLGVTAALHASDDHRGCVRVGEVALAEAEASGDADATAEALMLLASSEAIIDASAAGRYSTRAVELMRRTGDDARLSNTLLNLGVAEHNANRLDAALDHYAEAGEAFDRIGDVVGRALVTHNRGEVLADLGRVDEAREACTDSLRQFRAAGAQVGAALSQSALGRLAVFDGDPAGGLVSLEAALEAFERAGHTWYAADTQARIAECHVIFGSVDAGAAALASAERAAATVDPPGILPTWLTRLRGLLAWRSGDRAGAEALLLEAAALAEAEDHPVERVRALGCLVGVGLGPDTLRGERDRAVTALGLARTTAIPPADWA